MKLKLSEEELEKHKLAAADKEVLMADRLHVAHMDIEEQKSKLVFEEHKVVKLQHELTSYKNNMSRYEGTISDLKAALCHVQEHLFVSVAQLESDIGNLLEQKNQLEAELSQSKLQNMSLDTELRECKYQMMKIESSFREHETTREHELERLRAEQLAREELVAQLNKGADEFKCKYNTLESEKDDMTALLLTLSAELNSQNNEVRQLEVLVQKSCSEKVDVTAKLKHLNTEVISRTKATNRLISDLRSPQVAQKEEEAETLRAQIMEGAENKREAVRQLCFSLDYYKSGYRELCQAFVVPSAS